MEMREDDIELLWRYIDGQCSQEEQLQVTELLTVNARWKQAYDEIMSFNQILYQPTDLEQPSMRFTKNVMDAVQTEAFARKKYSSQKLIWIFSIMIAALTIVLVIAGITNIDWTSGKSLYSFKQVTIDRKSIVFTTLAVNTILILVLIDVLLKRNHSANN